MRLLLAALFAFALAGCDRFADDERQLLVVVTDDGGNEEPGVEVHALLHFAPPFAAATSLPVEFELAQRAAVTVSINRVSDGAQMGSSRELGTRPAGLQAVPDAAFDLPNGVYRVRVETTSRVVRETDLVINRVPGAAGEVPYLGRTGFDGQVRASPEGLSLGAVAEVSEELGGTPRAYAVQDSVTIVVVQRGTDRRAAAGVRLGPVGLTRLRVVLPE